MGLAVGLVRDGTCDKCDGAMRQLTAGIYPGGGGVTAMVNDGSRIRSGSSSGFAIAPA